MSEKFVDSTRIVGLTEPRIELIARQLQALLQVVELEHEGKAVQVDGFRLRNAQDWRADGPDLALLNLGSISGICNCACEFCYEFGQPPDDVIMSQARRHPLSLEEARTRLKYYDPHTESGLFRTLARYTETFTNPDLLAILELVREQVPDEYFVLTTNGSFLDEATIRRLAALKPVTIKLSLNSADPAIRQRAMRDRRPNVAIEAVPLMQQYGVQFIGSVVAWPTIPLDDIANTIRYLDAHDVLRIGVNLPGYTRHHPAVEEYSAATWRQWWDSVLALVRTVRPTVETPLFVSPYSYEDVELTPRVGGVLKNSPAARAGVQTGDVLLEIDGTPVVSRSHARDLLYKTTLEQPRPCVLRLARNGQEMQLDVAAVPFDRQDYYPYLPSGYPPPNQVHAMEVNIGLFIADGFRLMYIDQLYRAIHRKQAQKVLLLSSFFLQPLVSQILDERGLPPGVEIRVRVPENLLFGGNIVVGDLLTVDEFIACIERVMQEEGFEPDLVVIPSSPFSQWQRDFTGAVWLEVERRTGIPVLLLPVRRISP